MAIEANPLSSEAEKCIQYFESNKDSSTSTLLISNGHGGQKTILSEQSSVSISSMSRSAVLPLLPLTEEDELSLDPSISEEWFPVGQLDKDEQQVDLRDNNTWMQRLHQISSVEIAEVFAVNAIAPFLINSKLKSMLTAPQPKEDKYIINVSAMEGKFYRSKTTKHAHTNAAKAALNMMTHTSAKDYASDCIYMSAVDTGWVTDERPIHLQQSFRFVKPLDEVDGAARVLDPIFMGVNERLYDIGRFWKDYTPTEW